MERGREKKAKGLKTTEGGGVVEVVCNTRIKQTELVPCEKRNGSKILTGTIDFFLFTQVFSASNLSLLLLNAV